jgi:hypothetical protein
VKEPGVPERKRSNSQLAGAILERAAINRDFRERLLRDPSGAIYDTFGIEMPHNYTIRFIERDPAVDALVVLPDFRSSDDVLTDAELEAVAGGVGTGGAFKWEMSFTPEDENDGNRTDGRPRRRKDRE